MRSILAAWCLLAIASPAALAGFDWLNPNSWGDALGPPDPTPYARDADLSGVLGKVQLTQISGITSLTVVDYDQFALMLIPTATELTVRQIPKASAGEGRATQTSVLQPTSTLSVVNGPFFSWYAGAAENPVEAADDPTYQFLHVPARLSVPNVVPLEDLEPNGIVGAGATMTTESLKLQQATSGLRDNPAVLSVLDVDGQLKVMQAAPEYASGSTITSATTQAGIKAMLDEVSVVGATLSGVLTSLSSSTAPEIGSVNSDGVASVLATRGFTLRKVVSTGDPPQAVFVPDSKQIDLVNPSAFNGELVFTITSELKDVGEDRIVGLKSPTSTAHTQVLVLFDSMHSNLLYCDCYALIEMAPSLSGITDVYGHLLAAAKRIDDSATKIYIDPSVADAFHIDPLPGGRVDRLFVVDQPDRVSPEPLSDVLKVEPVTPPSGYELPDLWGNSLVYLTDVDTDRLDRDIPDVKYRPVWQDFTVWLPPQDAQETNLPDYLGQLQSLDPRQLIPVPNEFPSGLEPVGVDALDGLVLLAQEEAARDHADGLWSTLQIRTTTREARAPVSGANVDVEVYTPAFHGGTIQEFHGETNTLGYASFTVMPASLYNVTASKDGFTEAVALGATGGPGEESGKEVQMTPQGGWEGFVDGIFDSPGLVWITLGVLAAGLLVFTRTRRGKRLLRRLPGRRQGRRRFR